MTPADNVSLSLSSTANATDLENDTNIAALMGYVLVAFIGLPGNTLILLVYGRHTTRMTSSQLIIFSIAVVDFLGCLNLPLRYQLFYNKLFYSNPLNYSWLKVAISTTAAVTVLELSLLSLAAFERYRAVQNINNMDPLTQVRNRRKILGLIFMCFLITVSLTMFVIIIMLVNRRGTRTGWFLNSASTLVVFALFIFTTIIFIVGMYIKVGLLLHRRIRPDPQVPPQSQLQERSIPCPNKNIELELEKDDFRSSKQPLPTDAVKGVCEESSSQNGDQWWEIVLEEVRDLNNDVDDSTDDEIVNINAMKYIADRQSTKNLRTGEIGLPSRPAASSVTETEQQLPGVVTSEVDIKMTRSDCPSKIYSVSREIEEATAIPTIPSENIAEHVPIRQNKIRLLRKITYMLFIASSVCIVTFSLSPLARVFWPDSYLVFQELFIINYAINPFIYSIVNECFREECMTFFSKVFQSMRSNTITIIVL